jgi:cation diffusion facilitator CzcD-associated flavoprotein CzcO
MRLVNDVLPKNKYDVIVVGEGLGGMTAASLVAKRGLSVLMIDQQDKPGGSCTSFRRDGVTYDSGTTMLYSFGERGFKPFRGFMNRFFGRSIAQGAVKAVSLATSPEVEGVNGRFFDRRQEFPYAHRLRSCTANRLDEQL